MDHLLYPSSSHNALPQIPFLCDGETEYDGLPFKTYAIRRGWSETEDSLRWLQCDAGQIAKRVQLWLYFGLLSSFCGRVIPRATLRDIDQTGSIRLSTARIQRIFETWPSRKSEGQSEYRRQLLIDALRLSDLVEDMVTSEQKALPCISCSVRVLLETLNSSQGFQLTYLSPARRYSLGRRWPFRFSNGLLDGWKISAAKAIEYDMAERGWCPAQIANLSRKYSCATLYFLSGLSLSGTVRHEACTASSCVAYNIDEDTYVPLHRGDCGLTTCALIEVPSGAVANIIDDDYGIPLVSCSLGTDGRIQTKLIRATSNTDYTAISHVWSGGLGNPSKNGLPECQVRHLMNRIRSLRGRMSKPLSSGSQTLWWMDTFCIPIGKTLLAARKKAINSMAGIYSGANATLVLDPELQCVSGSEMEAEQLVARLLCSSWMSRCWTLQEASLSDEWYVEFNDGPVDMINVMYRLRNKAKLGFLLRTGSLKSSMRRKLVEELSSFLVDMGEVRYQRRGRYTRPEIWNLIQLESHQASVLATTWNNFLGRTTSKPEDLHSILAALEDIRVTSVQELNIQDRMKAILKCHATLPVGLLFCSCERMRNEDPVNAWAPAFPKGRGLDDDLGIMKVFTDCLFISTEIASGNLQIYLVPSKGFLSKFVLDLPELGRQCFECDSAKGSLYVDSENATACLIFPKTTTEHGDAGLSCKYGARFLLRQQQGDDLHIRFDDTFQLYSYNRENPDTHLHSDPLKIELLETAPRIFIGCSMSFLLMSSILPG